MKLFRSSACFFALAFVICSNGVFSESASEDSYSKHCSSVIPRYSITTRSFRDSLPSLSTSYFTGGDTLQRAQSQRTYNYDTKNLSLRLRPDHYQTTAAGVYNVEGFLYISFGDRPDETPGTPARESLRFPMNGFWSEKSRKLCMVGSTWWKGADLDAVLKLKFDGENPTVHSAVVSGSLESSAASANDPAYFDPVLIFDFPPSPNYKYSLVSEIGGVFPTRKGDESSSLSLDSTVFCSVMKRGLMSLEMEYVTECEERRRRRNRCSPIGFLPYYLALTSIQCEKESKRARFIAIFRNYSSSDYDDFPPNSTAIGEAWWDAKSNRINGVACPIVNSSPQLGNTVGDCTMRLSLNHPSVLTLRNDANIEGEIWSSKSADDSDYFRPINLTVTAPYYGVSLRPDQRYKYTELDRVRESCSHRNNSAMEKKKKKGNVYPDAESDDMRFDMHIKNGDGRSFASAFATPVWVEHDSFETGTDMVYVELAALRPPPLKLQKRDTTWPTRMSYRITINPHDYDISPSGSVSTPPSLDQPVLDPSGVAVITAEGLYDAETGQLCMVGCRKLARNPIATFKDCEIVVEFDLPMVNGERGRRVKGIVRSTRPETDPLHFDDLVMDSAAYNRGEAGRTIQRVDFEIAMVLISNVLVCIFVALQILHVKRNHEAASAVSLVMLVVLCAGHMIPLVSNFEEARYGESLKANEVAVRVITMVTLLLQLRLLQLVYAASKQRESSWSGEKRACFVSITFYVLGGLLALVLRRTHYDWRYSIWRDLRSYGGVILDGFLLPQIVLNLATGSGLATEALRGSFYVGTSAVRLAPHVYNQYRSRNYPANDLDGTYYYANPTTDLLYSTAWDIIIPCGIIALAVIVFLQQRKGGRCILPQRFRGFELD